MQIPTILAIKKMIPTRSSKNLTTFRLEEKPQEKNLLEKAGDLLEKMQKAAEKHYLEKTRKRVQEHNLFQPDNPKPALWAVLDEIFKEGKDTPPKTRIFFSTGTSEILLQLENVGNPETVIKHLLSVCTPKTIPAPDHLEPTDPCFEKGHKNPRTSPCFSKLVQEFNLEEK